MRRVAADHAAERHDAVIGLLLRGCRMQRDHDRGRNLERTRNRDEIMARAGILQHALGAAQQQVGNVVVVARLDDENARALDSRLLALGLPASSGH